MPAKKRLWVEVVGARNLESRHALDAYCVVQVVGARAGDAASVLSNSTAPSERVATCSVNDAVALGTSVSFASRSLSVLSSESSASWSHAIDVELSAPSDSTDSAIVDVAAAAAVSSARVLVQIFNEKNFFFDMFPASSGSSSSEADDSSSHVALDGVPPTVETDSEDDDECELKPKYKHKTPWDPSASAARLVDARSAAAKASVTTTAAPSDAIGSADESLGFLELKVAPLCAASQTVTDAWYLLRGTRAGEVRIRTLCVDASTDGSAETASPAARDAIFRERVSNASMRDRYGFQISEHAKAEWAHLRSYDDCREQRRLADWERAFGTHVFLGPLAAAKESSAVVRQLARTGIPRSWRERVYMNMSGAREKQQNAGAEYYRSLVEQAAQNDTATFRQIELDIDRTFGHSGTKICTTAGRDELRRILRSYSIRNPSVGYCQGLNFIVAFLTLAVDEEAAFWLLAVICEDLFPGYYTPTMTETQTDMLVLKELIADELPELDAFTADVGLPLELLGSQWLLCLFTTTFPSETVFRIFDCLFTADGARFVFPVILAHLRRLERTLIGLDDFQAVLSAMKDAENALLDADSFLLDAAQEADSIDASRILALREKHSALVRDEMQRAARVRALNRQLAVVYEIPAFSSYAAGLLRFFHDEAEVSSRSDVAFILTLLCHGLVWLAEHSKRWQR